MAESTPEQRAKRAAYMREWRLRPENHERVKAGQRVSHVRRKANPETSARIRQQGSASYRRTGGYKNTWNAKNPEKAKAYRAAWDAANPGKSNAAYRRWYERNRIVKAATLKAYQSARRARKANAGTFVVTDKDARRIMRNGCAYCTSAATEMDHIIPIARGGRHAIGNLVGSCRPCNRSKNHRTITEWRAGKSVPRNQTVA